MKGIIDEWGKEHRIEFLAGIDGGGTIFYKDLADLKQRISKAINYYDRQPATDEFSRGFEKGCKALRQKLLGSESTHKTGGKDD